MKTNMQKEAIGTDKISKFLDEMLSDEKFLSKTAIKEKTYSDEPIIRRASSLRSYTPDKIGQMRLLEKDPASYGFSQKTLFLQQARFMEDYTDDSVFYGSFLMLTPTYRLMSDRQLRGYFSWRTKLRQGTKEDAPVSFGLLYLYELINCVGEETPADCWYAIRDFGSKLTVHDRSLSLRVNRWLLDFAVCYGLGDGEKSILARESGYETYETLRDWRNRSEEEVTDALFTHSVYHISPDAFFKEHRSEVRAAVYYVFAKQSEKYEKRTKKPFYESCFGTFVKRPEDLFEEAVFCDTSDRSDREYVILGEFRFVRERGRWYSYRLERDPKYNQKLCDLIGAAEAVLRERYGAPSCGFGKAVPKQTEKFVLEFLAAKEEEERRKKAAEVKIDFSKLDTIRQESLITQEKLITEEEKEEEEERPAIGALPEKTPQTEQTPAEPEKTLSEPAVSGFPGADADEIYLLKSLLEGKDPSAYFTARGKMLTMVCDAVNEKLFDVFQDTVIFFDDGKPCIYEDYTEEIKEMVGETE